MAIKDTYANDKDEYNIAKYNENVTIVTMDGHLKELQRREGNNESGQHYKDDEYKRNVNNRQKSWIELSGKITTSLHNDGDKK